MLHVHELRKSFGPLVAVDGVSFTLQPGEVFGLLGPNGAGKSTTISMAIGLLTPDSGRVEIAGAGSPSEPRVRAMIGVAPQALALYDELSGEENLRFFGRMQGLAGATLRTRVEAALEQVGLSDRRRDRAGTYSGGMKRRLNLAAAIVHDPPLVLLDEPTAGVDPQSRNNILEMVRRMSDAGKTVLYTTHYMEEAQKLCDRVAIIDKGRILAMGSVEELIRAHGGDSVVAIHRGDAEELVRTREPVIVLQGVLSAGDVTSVRIDRPDLEGVFLGLTGRRLRD